MTLETWISFCLLEILLCMSPGPAVIYISSTAASRGMRSAMASVGGILLSNIFLFTLCGSGVAALLLASAELFTALRLLGGAYLAWLGFRMLLGRGGAQGPTGQEEVRHGMSALQGFLVQSSNPKALIFIASLLPQFLDPGAALAPQVAILAMSSVVIELAVLAGYASLALRAHRLVGRRGAGWFGRAAGLFLAGLGIRLALQ